MGVVFEWDPGKEATNLRKHGVAFAEAASVFFDPLSLTIPDVRHGDVEARFLILGLSRRGRLLTVVHADRGKAIRIISARPAGRLERKQYEDI